MSQQIQAMVKQALHIRNCRTQRTEVILQHDLAETGWGFHFFVESELEAYKAAYVYRDNQHGVKVEFAGGAKRWMVTVFNEFAKAIGLDGAR